MLSINCHSKKNNRTWGKSSFSRRTLLSVSDLLPFYYLWDYPFLVIFCLATVEEKLVDYWRVSILTSGHGKSKNSCQSNWLSCIFCIWKNAVHWREVNSKLKYGYAWHEVVRVINRKADFKWQDSLIKALVDIPKPESKGNVIKTNYPYCSVIVSESARIWKNISINWWVVLQGHKYFFI